MSANFSNSRSNNGSKLLGFYISSENQRYNSSNFKFNF